jgi:hypothetical protein
LTVEQKSELKTLAKVLSAEQIADYFGISRTTFFEIKSRDEEVSVLYKKGKSEAVASIAAGLLKKAQGGDLGAQIFFLKTQAGWKEKSEIEHTSPDESMKPTTIILIPEPMPDDERFH